MHKEIKGRSRAIITIIGLAIIGLLAIIQLKPLATGSTPAESKSHAPKSPKSPVEMASRSARLDSDYRPASFLAVKGKKREGTRSIVSGMVVDVSGNPIPGASLSVFGGRDENTVSEFFDRRLEAQSRSDGSFDFHMESPFEGWLLVDKDGYAALEDFLRLDARTEPKRYVLREAAERLYGQVVERGTGRPVSDAVVSCSFSKRAGGGGNGGTLMRTAVTDLRGEFSFSRIPVGDTAHLVVSSPAHLSKTGSVRLNEVGESQHVRFSLVPAKVLRVKVIDEWGGPISGAKVASQTTAPAYSASDGVAEIPTDAKGGPPVEYQVGAEGYLQRSVEIYPSADQSEVMLKRGPVFRISVFDDEGLPVSQAAVNVSTRTDAYSARGETDGLGVFETTLPDLPVAYVTVGHSDHLGSRVEIAEDADLEDIRITLHRGNSGIAGQVLSASGTPLEMFRIRLRRKETAGYGAGSITRLFSDGEGRFQLFGLPEGFYELTIKQLGQAQGSRPEIALLRDLELRNGEVFADLTIDLRPNSTGDPQ